MRSVVLREFGDPSVLRIEERPDPAPGPGEALVRVTASGVNWFEALIRRDAYVFKPELPSVLGVEAAGRIEAIGAGADPFAIGRRVAVPLFVLGGNGGYAEYITAPVEACVPIPDAVDDDAAVALMVQGLTALHAVRAFDIAGKSALVLAAAGGVGGLIVQFLSLRGARMVVGAVGTPTKVASVLDNGAHRGLTYDDLDPLVGEYDLVFDFAGSPLTEAALGSLAPQGQLLCGAMGRLELPKAALSRLMEHNLSIQGFSLLPLVQERLQEDLIELFQLASEGSISPRIGGRFALEAAAQAHAELESRRNLGKLVLTP